MTQTRKKTKKMEENTSGGKISNSEMGYQVDHTNSLYSNTQFFHSQSVHTQYLHHTVQEHT